MNIDLITLMLAVFGGALAGVAVMALVSINRGGDTDLLDTIEGFGWQVSCANGMWAVLEPQTSGGMKIIGRPASSLRGAVMQAIATLELEHAKED